ncbi:ketoacyl-synt-domain-containing protein [Cubamyces menziesii]|nr:ketoacyl-synt-domain-containing protein [Cubamyces menziesii]
MSSSSMPPPSPAEIAIVGIAAELPSGSYSATNLDHRSFFRFLLDRGEAYERIPLERFNIHTLVGSGLGKVATDAGSFLKDVHLFDHLEFGVTNKDARMMPLSTRRLIETAFLSLVDSGIDYRGRNIGCYTAGVAFDMFSVSGHDDDEARGSFASGPSMVANRVSYYLDLRGPSIPIDTACSSSLSATHLAVQAMIHGECEAAVVGGSQINHRFSEWLAYSQGGVLSPDGKCKPFDASANGFGRGEGVVCMVLKPLEAALRDGDKVYATILGTGINSCGSLAPVNAPVASAQREAMIRAFAQARRNPREVDFLELHSTGTAMGDPTEANWVGKEFCRDDELIVGSVKGNIGHLEITSFLASLCKVCSMFETGIIPPNANFHTPNPAIKWKEYKLRVPVEPEPLPARAASGRALVAMTSSGIGGSNASAVIQGSPAVQPKPSAFWRQGLAEVPLLFIAGGLSPRSTAAVGSDIAEKSQSWTGDAVGDLEMQIARAYGRRARSMTWRSFAVKKGETVTKFTEPILAPRIAPPVVFVFSGQGPQHYAMGREMFKSCAVFRESILQLDKIYKSVMGQSLVETTGIFDGARPADPLGEIWPISITLVSLTMLQIALFDTLAAVGVSPDVIVGHSAGETPLLYASGSGSRALAMELAIARGKAMTLLEKEKGTMAALSCSPERAEEVIADVIAELGPGVLEVGCYNAPGAVTLSGHEDYIELAVKKASDAGIFARRLRTRIPVHSAMMEICAEEYQRLVGDVFSRYEVGTATVETWSTKTGALLDSVLDAQYYWDNTRGAVRFTEALQSIAQKHPHAIYVELGPHPVLTSYVASMAGKNAVTLCPLRRPRSTEKHAVEVAGLMDTLGKLVVSGYTRMDFDVLYGTAPAPAEALPPFPFARKDIPYTAPTAQIAKQKQHRNGPLNYPQLHMNDKTHPDLAEHVIKNEPIMSTAGYIEMALEFGARKVYNIELVSILSLSAKRPTPVEIRLEGSRWSVLSAANVDYYKTWPVKYNRLHAKGLLSTHSEPEDIRSGRNVQEISSRLKPVDIKGFYDGFRTFADYGPTYQRVVGCSYARDPATGNDEWLVKLRGADKDLPDIADYRIHPAILDASLHILVHPIVTGINDPARYYLPSRIGALVVHDALLERPFPSTIYTYATFKAWTPETLVYDLLIMTEDGTPLYSVDELEISMHGQNVPRVSTRFEVAYHKTGCSVTTDGEFVKPEGDSTTPSSGRTSPGTQSTDSGYAPTEITVPDGIDRQKSSSGSPSAIVLPYRRGLEMKIQEVVKQLDALSSERLWFYASAGADGDALVGFVRALRKEFLTWSIHAVVFDSAWAEEDIAVAMKSLSSNASLEPEIIVEADGSISVPRIVEAAAPPTHAEFNTSLPWKQEKASVVQVTTPYVPPDHVLVHVTGAAMGTDQLWSFVGRTGDGSPLVAGVASGPLANIVVAHKFSLLELSKQSESDPLPQALPAAIASLAVSVAAFSRPDYLRQKVILVTHSDTTIGAQVAAIYTALGTEVVTLPSQYSVAELKAAYARGPQVIVSGSQDDSEAKTFRDMVTRYGRVFLWNHPDSGIAYLLQTDPCSIGDALRAAWSYQPSPSAPLSPPLKLVTCPLPESVPLATGIFDPSKSYVLLGGIGSLGLQQAHWMYQNGARELLLTSRSAREGLRRRHDYTALRYLDYLEKLPGLRIIVAATGSAPTEELKKAVGALKLPVGGCFILSGVLVDRSFVSQTEETFEAPFPAKVDAFKLVEEVLPVEKLDFLVTFSSVSGMFGNAGQTNYASANTSLAGLTKKYRNAVCIVAPAILDTSTIKGELAGSSPALRLKHLSNWGMTSTEFFTYVEDAIRCLGGRAVWQYIPAFDWALVQSNMGASPLFDDLVPAQDADAEDASAEKSSSNLKDVVCKILDVAPEDLSLDVPFTSYGLDSLSAAALSYALRPFINISQLQLLADLSLKELQARMEASEQDS